MEAAYGEQVITSSTWPITCASSLKKRPGYEMPDFVNVCFWYVPEKFRSMKPGRRGTASSTRVAAHNGGYQPLGNLPELLRMIVSKPRAATEADIDFLLTASREVLGLRSSTISRDEAGLGGGGRAGGHH
uniref:Uncharacterized protein n=1 Tax=Macrostomum lignano TaxID=282301 RepID=A0A1I8FA14_9PLAT